MTSKNLRIVNSTLVGEVWPAATPAEDPVLYGQAELSPEGAFQVRTFQTFNLKYTVGRFGLDDNGSIRVVFRFFGDWGGLQVDDPASPNFVTAVTSLGTKPSLKFEKMGGSRPWMKALTVGISGGYLSEGDTITITFGDTSGGSPGFKMQTFVESGFEFKVLVDACAVLHWVPILDQPSISIVPGLPVTWKAVTSTLRRPGEIFQLGIKAEDDWGNPSNLVETNLRIEPNMPVKNLPKNEMFSKGQKAVVCEKLTVSEEGELRIKIYNSQNGKFLCEAGPLIISEGAYGGYWADLHGQSGESIGVTNAREYFDFARDLAFLDAISHQANDFQVNNAFWKYLNELTASYNQEGRFVTIPGYEWSGNTSVGGDRNVYFRQEGRQIRRSSHALLTDQSDIDTDVNDARELFAALKDEDCFAYAHVGGRYADIKYAHDPKIETAMEIHSAWGTFEWLLTDGFPLGHRSGVVCNSDGHKGRPGASYPGASMFGAYGGLTCFYAEELSRDGLFDCIKKRHHYGTTGNRLYLTVNAHFEGYGNLFDLDPNAYEEAQSTEVKLAMMGDIVQTEDPSVKLKVLAKSPTPIERIEIRNGVDVIETVRGYTKEDMGDRYRVIWSGAEYRGRGRNTNWVGQAIFKNTKIERFEKINAWNHEKLLEIKNGNCVQFDAITTGNFGGFDVWLSNSSGAEILIESNQGELNLKLDDLGVDDVVLDCGGLERKLKVVRLPDNNTHCELSPEIEVNLNASKDNPLWVCVTTEDGFQAWSSPIFIFK